jgi:hypothetical protein
MLSTFSGVEISVWSSCISSRPGQCGRADGMKKLQNHVKQNRAGDGPNSFLDKEISTRISFYALTFLGCPKKRD